MKTPKISNYRQKLSACLTKLDEANSEALQLMNAMLCDDDCNIVRDDVQYALNNNFSNGSQLLTGLLDVLAGVIQILVVEPHTEPYVKEVQNDLDALQSLVGGYLDSRNLDDGVVLLCNENESNHQGFSTNAAHIDRHKLTGTFFLAGHDGKGEFISLSDEQIEKFTQLLQ